MNFDERIPSKPTSWNNDRMFFFKYCSVEVAKIVLKNKTLRWSTPKNLNDAFDVQFDMEIKSTKDELRVPTLEKLWDVFNGRIAPNPNNALGAFLLLFSANKIKISKEEFFAEFSQAFDTGYENAVAALPRIHNDSSKLMENVKLLCLSAAPDINLMWAHYADSHKGVVLRFRSIPAFDTSFGLAKPINYVENIPELLSKEFLIDMGAGLATMDIAGIIDRLVYTKSSDWSYEKEWRICAGAGREPDSPFEDVPFGRNDIDGIVFGLKTSAEDREELKQMATGYPNIAFYEAARERSAFNLSISEI